LSWEHGIEEGAQEAQPSNVHDPRRLQRTRAVNVGIGQVAYSAGVGAAHVVLIQVWSSQPRSGAVRPQAARYFSLPA
jgi:hypothetical protein